MKTQRGQAIVEMLVVVVAILMLLWGLLWLQRWQQIKLQTQHHAALQAFRFSHSHEVDPAHIGLDVSTLIPEYLSGLYSPISHQERTNIHALGVMPEQHRLLGTAQKEGLLGATQRWRFNSTAQAQGWQRNAWAQRLFDFVPNMQLQSQTSIWVGAGHANHDVQAIQRLEMSTSLWQYAQKGSTAAIKTLTPLLKVVDTAWGRKSPSTKWLQPWQESVPAHHMQ